MAAGSLKKSVASYIFFWSAIAEGRKREKGVGIALQNDYLQFMVGLFDCKVERLMTKKFDYGDTVTLHIISANAPSLKAKDVVKKDFYQAMDMVLQLIPATDRPLLLGDFNACVGRNRGIT